MSRYFEFTQFTDDTAPDYDGKLAVVTTGMAIVPVLATAAIAAGIERTLIGEIAADAVGVGSTLLLVLFVTVGLLVATGIRRYAVKIVDSGDWTKTRVLVGALVVMTGLYVGVFVDAILSIPLQRIAISGGVCCLVVLITNGLVLGTDVDFSWVDTVATGVALITAAVVMAAPIVWWFSTDGAFWGLFTTMTWALGWILLPGTYVGSYFFDVWRNAEEGMTPAVNAMTGFVSLITVGPIVLERIVRQIGTILQWLGEEQ